MTAAHFGVTIPQIKRPWVAAAEAAGAFERMGYDSLWVCDHFYGPQSPQLPILEAWSMVSALAAITEQVEIGTLVTPAGMRNAAQLGKVIATADNIAGGRVIAGLGAGWMPREFTDFGVPSAPPPSAWCSCGKRWNCLSACGARRPRCPTTAASCRRRTSSANPSRHAAFPC